MKAESTLFTPNRSVGITAGWLAYVLTKGKCTLPPSLTPGRVRLIDSTSGARVVLQLPEATGILDLAVIPDRVAVVGSDHSVTVFSVPTEWQTDNPPCDIITHIQYDASSLGQINRVEWLRKSGEDHLAVGGDAGVIIIRPEKGEVNMSDLERTATVLKTEGVSNLLDSANTRLSQDSASTTRTKPSVFSLPSRISPCTTCPILFEFGTDLSPHPPPPR